MNISFSSVIKLCTLKWQVSSQSWKMRRYPNASCGSKVYKYVQRKFLLSLHQPYQMNGQHVSSRDGNCVDTRFTNSGPWKVFEFFSNNYSLWWETQKEQYTGGTRSDAHFQKDQIYVVLCPASVLLFRCSSTQSTNLSANISLTMLDWFIHHTWKARWKALQNRYFNLSAITGKHAQ